MSPPITGCAHALADNVPELDQLVLAHTAASKSAVVDVELK